MYSPDLAAPSYSGDVLGNNDITDASTSTGVRLDRGPGSGGTDVVDFRERRYPECRFYPKTTAGVIGLCAPSFRGNLSVRNDITEEAAATWGSARQSDRARHRGDFREISYFAGRF